MKKIGVFIQGFYCPDGALQRRRFAASRPRRAEHCGRARRASSANHLLSTCVDLLRLSASLPFATRVQLQLYRRYFQSFVGEKTPVPGICWICDICFNFNLIFGQCIVVGVKCTHIHTHTCTHAHTQTHLQVSTLNKALKQKETPSQGFEQRFAIMATNIETVKNEHTTIVAQMRCGVCVCVRVSVSCV